MGNWKFRLGCLLQSWRGFSRSDRWLLVQTLFILPLMALLLRLFGFTRVYGALTDYGSTSSAANGVELQERAKAMSRVVEAAANGSLYRAECLPRSLTLWWYLRRQGIDSELQIGLSREASGFQGHAWVEYDGVALNDEPDVRQRFAALEWITVTRGDE